MKKNVLLLLFPFIILGTYSQNRNTSTPSIMENYEKEWAEINEDEKNQLPSSALSKTERLLDKALQENNTQQIIKSLLYKAKFTKEIDTDSTTFIFPELENAINQTENKADKAILHSLLAELYLQYYQANSWIIDRRTDLSDTEPEDIREWTQLNFKNKITDNLNQSIHDEELLLSILTDSYNEIIVEGETSTNYFPTLYDFLMQRAIDISSQLKITDLNRALSNKNIEWVKILPINNSKKTDFGEPTPDNELLPLVYYQHYISSLSQRKMEPALIFTLLSEIEFLSTHSAIFEERYEYSLLTSMWEKYRREPVSTEIVLAIVNQLTENSIMYVSDVSEDIQLQNKNLTEAYEWLIKGLELHPEYERINILREKLNELETPFIEILTDAIFYPSQKDKMLKMNYRNVDKVKIEIVRLTQDSTRTKIKESEIYLNPPTSYLTNDTTLNLEITQAGKYMVSLSFRQNRQKDIDEDYTKKEEITLYVTDVVGFCKVKSEQEYEFYVVDREKGKPLKDTWIDVLKEDSTVTRIKTNDKGFANYTSHENLSKDYPTRQKYKYRVLADAGSAEIKNSFPYSYQFTRAENSEEKPLSEKINIFTDRDIYRPGQTIYFKSVFTQEQDKNIIRPIENKAYEVKLYNTNSQLISNNTFTTNEFGSIAGEFIIPQNTLSGNYYLQINDTYKYIRVEEYKRPTFQITFDPIKETYSFGESISIKGNVENFSGVKLQDATVNYTITKSNYWLWNANNELIKNGNVTTHKDGTFTISFTIPENDSQNVPFWRNISRFTITASVTDLNGETQSENFYFAVGKVSMILSTNIGDKINKESSDTINIVATNLNGQGISTTGDYTIYSLTDENRETVVKKGSFTTGKQLLLTEEIKKLPSGKYKLKLKAKDNNGQEVENETTFVLYSSKDKRPPIHTNEWFITDKNKFQNGKNAEIVVGISATDITVLYELVKSEKVFHREQIKFNNENKTFSIPYREEYGENVYAVFTYVIDNKFYSNAINITKEQATTSLNLKFEVFRDKLRPGQTEEWRISVKDTKNNPVVAELLASMYDKSLDKIYPTQTWYLTIFSNNISSYPITFNQGENFAPINRSYYLNYKDLDYPSLDFDILNLFGFNFIENRLFLSSPSRARNMEYAVADGVLREEAVSAKKGYFTAKAEGITVDSGFDESSTENIPVQIRQNFNETAFFYPQLKTDKDGETVISFIVPESNTTWKFRALAYDKFLNNGILETEVVSRKELMVTPNLPRFVRVGDKTSISTKISNLSEKDLTGKVFIEFFDPYTDKTVDLSVSDATKNFSIDTDNSTSVNWEFSVPSGIELIGCRIVAENESFSDGEQHILPVLSSQLLITEAMPIYVNGNETKNISFDKFLNQQSGTQENYRLTFEYTSNPAWYAIQALPVLSNPDNENAVNWFASYYVNSVGASIIQQYPKVKNAIEIWKKQGESGNILPSNLLENQELKNILLEETPWVLEAEDEQEQLRRLSLLLDMNNSNYQTARAISQLQDLQNSDGGWSWYKGMSSSRSITQYILYGFTQLVELNIAASEDVKFMQMNAIKYIDAQIRKEYNDIKNRKDWEKTATLSTNQLEYLYVRSGYRDIPIDQETREAERFYTSIAEKNWTKLNLYERSILAVTCWRNGNKELANKIIASLRERATIDNEKGMFWANNRSTVFMSQSAISTHVFIMNAFKETNSASIEELDLMKLWLISQKRTQLWETTHATTDAIFALLSFGSDWFSNERKSLITVGQQVLESTEKRAITGYVKESWEKNEINPELGKIKIEQSKNSPGYGAMYWQYFENINEITKQSGVLDVNKKTFKEVTANNQVTLQEVSENNILQVGEKVVIRITVRADRDFGFVHLKDMRAACFEPMQSLSGIRWQNGVTYYQSTKDASTNFFFDYLPKGTYVFEYPVYVNRSGEYANGISTIQCMYAPEFISHTAGERISVE